MATGIKSSMALICTLEEARYSTKSSLPYCHKRNMSRLQKHEEDGEQKRKAQ